MTRQATYSHIQIRRYDKQSMKHINAFKYVDAMRYFDISLYNDITIKRCIQKAGMMRENAKAKITAINRDAIPVFRLITENAIASKNQPCRYLARFIQRIPEPTSRKDYCKPLASTHLLVEIDNFR